MAFPVETDEVASIVRICFENDTPIIPYGTGTAVEGGVVATRGGVCINLSRMNQIVRLSVDDADVTVQAGVTRKALNDYLIEHETGLTFTVDPGADASLGGMAATNASGSTAVRYGTMRENVMGLTVVMADGTIIHTGGRARKSSSGYDLTRLMVGSEGSLGIITEVTLRLQPMPAAVSSAVCPFPDIGPVHWPSKMSPSMPGPWKQWWRNQVAVRLNGRWMRLNVRSCGRHGTMVITPHLR